MNVERKKKKIIIKKKETTMTQLLTFEHTEQTRAESSGSINDSRVFFKENSSISKSY